MTNLLSIFIFISLVSTVLTIGEERKLYIAYMGSIPEGKYSPSLHHREILDQIIDPSFARQALIRSYTRSFNGFAAYLSQEEHQKLARIDGVLSVFPSKNLRPQTTRSWDFMGFPRTVERRPVAESDIIIGVIDSGIWPESESFNDEGLGPTPEKWRGVCAGGSDFTCNKKIIGARVYSNLEVSARDREGHGTHVASIAAGIEVQNANYYGLANGIARGGVPSARLAIYKACSSFCSSMDVLSAFDDAIEDGVDIISISLGLQNPGELTNDAVAIGGFHAVEKGVLTVTSAGNAGRMYSVSGYAPWIFSVGASYTDRRIIDKVVVGEGTILEGDSINAFESSAGELPLVYGKEVTNTCSEKQARDCLAWCLESSKVKQKVVLCDSHGFLAEADAFGYIIPNKGHNVSDVTPSRIAALSTNDINLVKTYKNSAKKPMVKIFKSEEIKNPAAALVAPFSSRGPVKWIPDFIKPDVIAPGVEILAAYSPMASPSKAIYDKRSVKYNILSGTSMACPHVAAAAAFVKSFHPNWSPSAIKSALMTTAWEMNATRDADAEFAYGSGHIDPVKATDPGLVYETFTDDYLKLWCNVSKGVGSSRFINASCPVMKLTPRELNYPSMAVQVGMKSSFMVSFPRTVTNVGPANSTYVASIRGGSNLNILVEPNILYFNALNKKKTFVVTVRGSINSPLRIERDSLLWTDGIHQVRSPIVVYTPKVKSKKGEGAKPPSPVFSMICFIVNNGCFVLII